MKILYGVQGTGNGHIARARIMANAFATRSDIEVDFLFSGRDHDKYFDMAVFGTFETRRGLSFATHEGNISYIKTFWLNSVKACWKEIKQLDVSGYDVVINDFEPITAWAAKRQGKPCINISHQASFLTPIPQAKKTWVDRLIMRYFAPSTINLGVHWYHFGAAILPPFITLIGNDNTVIKSDILVYLPFESLAQIEDCLNMLPEYKFIIFHPDVIDAYEQNNLSMRPLGYEPFQMALQSCSGVIANAGFELSSEALSLGKKLLLKPLGGQFEQMSNIITLEQLGLCELLPHLSFDIIEDWLAYTSCPPITYPDQSNTLVDWIAAKQWHDAEPLCEKLWQQVKFPTSVARRIKQLQ